MNTQSATSPANGRTPHKRELLRLRPLGPIEVLDTSFTLYAGALGQFLTLAAIPIVIAAALDFGVNALTPEFGTSAAVVDTLSDWITTFLGIGVAVALVTRAAVRIWWGRQPETGTTLRASARLWAHTSGVIAIFAIAWIPPAFGSVLLAGDPVATTAPTVVLVVTIPIALIVSLVLSLSLATLEAEGLAPGSAAARSARLMRRGTWGRAIVTYFVVGLLLVAVFIGFDLGIAALLDLLPGSDSSLLFLGAGAFASFVEFTLAAPLVALLPVAMYFESRIRLEGLDVDLLVAEERKGAPPRRSPAARETSAPL